MRPTHEFDDDLPRDPALAVPDAPTIPDPARDTPDPAADIPDPAEEALNFPDVRSNNDRGDHD